MIRNLSGSLEDIKIFEHLRPGLRTDEMTLIEEDIYSTLYIDIEKLLWVEEGTLLGCLEYVKQEDNILVALMYVRKDFRGKNIGSNLINELKNMFEGKPLITYSNDTIDVVYNEEVYNFFTKNNFIRNINSKKNNEWIFKA